MPDPVAPPTALLAGRTALVTGAAAGIGAAITTLYAAHGATVLAVDTDAAALADLPPGVQTLVADVTDPDFPAQVAEHPVDVLVNNVGHFLRAPVTFADASPEEWEPLAEVNLNHALRLTHAVLPGMIARGRGGSIINLTTVEAHRGIPGHVIYSTYKAALRHFTRSLSLEVGRHQIRVNNIAPDLIETPQVPYQRLVAPEDRERWPRWAPLGGPGQPADVAGPALFLASDLSRYMTGSTLHVDGGSHAAGGWFPRADGSWTNRPMNA
ncbi:SDR family oxidoreductase [Rhodococcus sp. X156]|uniref:SDR family NAD(P)-dependent oxidoreductase n=1 Tax=Rhodococcus sp. X156 TaxID=2499145 RepID=UPI001F4936ED|nr:SDR family oxidoreductase [Rhodococcus sp. X156]